MFKLKATIFFLVIAAITAGVFYYMTKTHTLIQGMDNTTSVSVPTVASVNNTASVAENDPTFVPIAARGQSQVVPIPSNGDFPALPSHEEDDVYPYATLQGVNQSIKPEDLLPGASSDANVYASNNPTGAAGTTNFLTPGFSIGINSSGGARKNGSTDIRKVPVIPKVQVGVLTQSSFLPDLSRKSIDEC